MAVSTVKKDTFSAADGIRWAISLGVPAAIWFLTPFDAVLRAYLAISLGGILSGNS